MLLNLQNINYYRPTYIGLLIFKLFTFQYNLAQYMPTNIKI